MILPYFLFPYCTSGNNILALGHMFCPDGLELSLCVIKTTNGNIIRKYFRKYNGCTVRKYVCKYIESTSHCMYYVVHIQLQNILHHVQQDTY